MKNTPDPASLLDDVLAEPSSTAGDSLAAVLRAVRTRRRRRQLSPALTVLSLLLIAAWLVIPRQDTLRIPAATAVSALVLDTPAVRVRSVSGVVERVGSVPLIAAERVATSPNAWFFARVRTQPDITDGATDEELLALAGGRGVALARMADGHTELLFAQASR